VAAYDSLGAAEETRRGGRGIARCRGPGFTGSSFTGSSFTGSGFTGSGFTGSQD